MKRLISLILLSYCGVVLANNREALRYIGFDLGKVFSKHHILTNRDEFWSRQTSKYINVYVGYKLGDYASFEFGGFKGGPYLRPERMAKTNIDGLHMGFVFFLPILKNLSLIPGMGMTQVNIHSSELSAYNMKNRGIVPRLLVGAQYHITKELHFRSSIVWHRMSSIYSHQLTYNKTLQAGIGLNYSIRP